LDFDLEVAASKSADNPVYYVQYVHARICSVFKTAHDRGLALPEPDQTDMQLLTNDEEFVLIKHLAGFPNLVEGAALNLEPHRLTHYLIDLAKKFHPYYRSHRFVSEDRNLSRARLVLAKAVQQVVANGLSLLGVSAPETM
jgi:arginyl-tRNA synthetase